MTEIPTKCVSSTVTFDIKASILYIDFEGRTDGESIRRILSQIKPRQLVSHFTRLVMEAYTGHVVVFFYLIIMR